MNPLIPPVMGGSGGGSGSGGVSGLDTANGGTALADNVIVRGDGTTGIQGSGVSISDADVVSGATQLNVDNLRLDGNTLSSTNSNGNVNLTPDGTGEIILNGFYTGFGTNIFLRSGSNNTLDIFNSSKSAILFRINGGSGILFDDDFPIKFGSTVAGTMDVGFNRSAAGSAIITDASTGIGNLYTKQPVEANTATSGAPNVLAVTESRKILTNEGTGAENYHALPTAAPGLVYEFHCVDGNGIRAVASGSDRIRVIGSVTGAGGYVSSATPGSVITLKGSETGRWYASSIHGIWDIDGAATFDDSALIV